MAELSTQPVRFRKQTLDNVSWTPVFVSAHASRIRLTNQGEDTIYLRTDDTNADSEFVLYPGAEKLIDAFGPPNVPIVYAKTTSSTGPLVVDEIVPR